MAIKNYTSNTPQTFDKIQKILISHKAKQILFDYTDNGKIKSLSFNLEINGKFFGFRLPARVEKVEKIFLDRKSSGRRHHYRNWELTEAEKEQAYRTAWANIRD